jgi:hypothetical protein
MHIEIIPNHNKREGFCFWVRHGASWCDVQKTDSKSGSAWSSSGDGNRTSTAAAVFSCPSLLSFSGKLCG